MRLTNWLTNWLPRPNRASRRAGAAAPAGLRKPRPLAIESLEDRLVPATTLFIDFGLGLTPSTTATATELRNVVQQPGTPPTPVVDSGPDLASIGAFGTPAGANVTIQKVALGLDYNGNGVKGDDDDIAQLRDAVVSIVERQYAPFDIEVKTSKSADLAGIRTALQSNNTATDGKFDAYVLVGTYTSDSKAGASVALGTGTYGLTATKDLFARVGNRSDEVVAAFADEVLADTPNFAKVITGTGGPATAAEIAAFKTAFEHRLAYTIAHEAAHSFGLAHTDSTATHVNGDVISQSSTTRETNNIVTRFSLPLVPSTKLGIPAGAVINNYDSFRTDPDIGLVDANRNNVPDFAYVTGTGGKDRITLAPLAADANGRARVRVTVEALDAPTSKIEYDITAGLEGPNANSNGTDGLIRIDASTGNDLVVVNPGVTFDVLVYGGDGDDTIEGGGGNDQLFGEKGNDSIGGGAGNDAISGGAGNDTLSGGAGDDLIAGFEGNDLISGDANADTLIGGTGNDTLSGGADADVLHGSDGTDSLDGGAGDDELWGGAGADTLSGGADIDTLRGGEGIDSLDGGTGADEIHNPGLVDTIVNDPADRVVVPLLPGNAPGGVVPASATGTLSVAQVNALKAGLKQVVMWAQSAGGALATGTDTAGAILADTLQRGLVADVFSYLNGVGPTIQGLVALLKQPPTANQAGLAVTTSNVTATKAADGSPRFVLHFRATRTADTAVDLAKLGAPEKGVRATGGGPIQVPLESRVGFNLAFGVDGSTFYVQLPTGGVEVFNNISASTAAFPAAVGLLTADAGAGRVDLTSRTTFTPADANADGKLTVAELQDRPPAVAQAGSLAAEIPLAGQIGTDAHAAVLTVTDGDLSDNLSANPTPAQRPTVVLTGSADVQALARVNAFSVLEFLKQFGDRLDQVAAAAQLAASVPFTGALKLKDVADFATAFRTRVIDRLVNPDGTPNFTTAQELIARLSTSAGGPSALRLNYDPHAKELTFGLNFERVFDLESALAVSQSIPHVAALQLNNALVQLKSTVTGGVTFSIDLATPIDESQPGAVLNRFTLRDASFDARVTAGVTGVTGSARLGVFELGVVNGGATVNLGVSFRASGSLAGLNIVPAVSGSANVNLPIQLAAQVGGITLPVNTGIVINWADVTNPGTLSASLSPAVSLDAIIADLESVAIGQVVEGVKRVVNFLRDVQSRGVFQQKLPVLNRTLADLLDTSEKLDALARELETNPPQTITAAIQRVNALLGSAAAVRFQNRVLEFDLRQAFGKTLDLDLSFDLDNSLGGGILEQFVDVNGSAPTRVSIGGLAALNLVIDLSNPTSPVFAIKDTSSLSLTALVNSTNINLEAAIGPLGVFIRGGTVRLDSGTAGQPASFTVGLNPGTNGRHTLGDLIGNPGGVVRVTPVGKFDANLPVAFPTVSETRGRIHVFVDTLADIPGTTHLDTAVLPDFGAAINSLDVGDLIGLVIEGLDRALGQIEKRFDLPSLPLIGGDLKKATAFLRDVRERVVAKLEGLSQLTAAAVRAKLFEALGPGGLNLLVKRTGTGPVTADDITVTFSTTEKRAEVEFRLAGSYTVAAPGKLDLGLPGLGLNLDAAPNFTVKLDRFDVGFGVSAADGFYLKTSAGTEPELQISVEAAVSGPAQLAQLMASLGFLKFTATDQPVVQPDGGLGSFVSGILSLDLREPAGTPADRRLTLGELQSADLDEVLKANVNLDANVQLKLSASFGTSPNFPRVETDFKFIWKHHTGAAGNGVQTIGFENVRLNLGEFISNTLGPILASVQKSLSPFTKIATALTEPIAFLKDLGLGNISIADFIGVDGSTKKFLDTVRLFGGTVDQINSTLGGLLTPADGVFVRLGSFTLNPAAAADPNKLGKLDPISQLGTNLTPEDQASLASLKAQTGFAVPIFSNPASVFKLVLGQDVPLVTYTLPKLDINFTYSKFIPIFTPVLGVRLTGTIRADSNLSFGFDTRGLRQFAAGGFDNPKLILNGLYVSDTENADGTGKDVPELTLTAGLEAFAAVNLGFLEFGGGGGLRAQVSFDLKDPDNDGKLYFQELADVFAHPSNLGSLVDIRGKLTAGLSVYISIPFLPDYTKTIGEVTLFSFEPTTTEPPPVLGETDAQGVLRLNAGPRAGQRLYRGETVDGDEQFTITPGANASTVVVSFKGFTQTFTGVTKIVGDGGEGDDTITVAAGVVVPVELRGGNGSDRLTAGGGPATLSGGAGNDTLVATSSPAATLSGDDGNDSLVGGGGADVLNGGAGNDTLSGGAGGDTLSGGAGDDVLNGDGGADTLNGDDGNDSLSGGADNDTLHGGSGRDTLSGGDHNDVLLGGDDGDLLTGDGGADVLNGNAGDDTLSGGIGNDTLLGDSGNDRLLGDADVDQLTGGIGDDTLSGGAGTDTLRGGVGADVLEGDGDADALFGETGADQLFGGDGHDTLDGGIDADELSGGAGNDTLLGDRGPDRLYGFGFLVLSDGSRVSNDQSPDGNDTLLGGDGDDSLFGGQGNDALQGGVGADLIDGESGEDRIQYAVDLVDPSADTLRGGAHLDVIEILGTEGADSLTAQQISPTTFRVDRRDPASDAITSTFQFTLPAALEDRDIELLRVSGLGGSDAIRLLGTFNINKVLVDGGAGDDLIVGSGGDDSLTGGIGNDTIQGAGGADELFGGEGNDVLDGGAGEDALYGEAGNDVLDGGADYDVLFGGSGNDTLASGSGATGGLLFGDFEAETATDGADVIIGDDGQDVIRGGGGGDRIEGRGGADVIKAGSGNDTVLGEAGNDVIDGDADSDTLMGGAGADVIDGGSGGDRLYAVTDVSTADPTRPAGQFDVLIGLDGDDTLRGSDLTDRLIGGSGNDTFEHTTGNDSVFGITDPAEGPGTPVPNEFDKYVISGTGGDDIISLRLTSSPTTGGVQVAVVVNGVAVNATHSGIEVVGVAAGDGNDTVTVEFGQNAAMKVDVDGGTGNDWLDAGTFQNDATLRGGTGDDTLTGGNGNDRLDGGDGNDSLTGGIGSDTLLGGDGNDTITGGDGADSIDGGLGMDRLVESTPGTAVLGTYQLDRVFGLTTITDLVYNIEEAHLTGGDTDDTISAGGFLGRVTIVGGAGNDTLTGVPFNQSVLLGGDGNDFLRAGNNADFLDGGAGNDTLTGGASGDTLIGGDGIDLLIDTVNGNWVLTDTQLAGYVTDTLSGIEAAAITGSVYNDRIDASAFSGNVTLSGGDGNDTLIGGAGNDVIYGGNGSDQLYGQGGNDYLSGEAGNDWLDGGSGNDTLYGGIASDTLIGGAGSDYLDGGADGAIDYLYGTVGIDNCVTTGVWKWVYNSSTGVWTWTYVVEDRIIYVP